MKITYNHKYSSPILPDRTYIRGMQTTQCLLLYYLRQVTAVIETGFEPVSVLKLRRHTQPFVAYFLRLLFRHSIIKSLHT